MFFIRGSKQGIDKQFIDDCVRAFFTGVVNLDWSGKDLSELFRYTMCRVLSLQTQIADDAMCIESDRLYKTLNAVGKRYAVKNYSTEVRQGCLEACVHCMEMSRRRAGE